MLGTELNILNVVIGESGPDVAAITNKDNYDEKEIPIPGSKEITVDEYNDAIDALQKSFKEAVNVLDSMKGLKIVENNIDDLQEEYTENAIYESIINGPIYEAVKAANKEQIKEIVSDIKNDVAKFTRQQKLQFIVPNKLIQMIRPVGDAYGVVTNPQGGSALAMAPNFWKTRLWQIVGNVIIEPTNVDAYFKAINEEFKDKLDEFKLVSIKYEKNLADYFRTSLGYKNHLRVYGIIVDKKLPAEYKDIVEK